MKKLLISVLIFWSIFSHGANAEYSVVVSKSIAYQLDIRLESFSSKMDIKFGKDVSGKLAVYTTLEKELHLYKKKKEEYALVVDYLLQKVDEQKKSLSILQKKLVVGKDIKYSNNCVDCVLDIYYNNTEIENKKVIFFVHGGAWKAGDKSLHEQKGEFFVKNGYVFVSVNYTLFPEANYDKQIAQAAQALKYIIGNVSRYNGDEDNIILMGHSAGGHIVSMLSTDEKYLNTVGLDITNIKSTILLDAAGLDIPTIKNNALLLFKTVYQPIFGKEEKELVKASPISFIAEGKQIPEFLIFYSNLRKNTEASHMNFYNSLQAEDVTSFLYGVAKSHEEINNDIGSSGDVITKKVLEFLQ